MLRNPASLLCALALTGCALVTNPGNQRLAESDLRGARDAYLEILDSHGTGRRVEVALYNLGLIYLQPDSDLYDPVAAQELLTRLTYLRPQSAPAARARLLLELHSQADELRARLEAQVSLTREAREQLELLTEEASETEARSQDQSKKVGQLGSRIGQLRSQIDKLREELAATNAELTAREQELERLKRIDLEGQR